MCIVCNFVLSRSDDRKKDFNLAVLSNSLTGQGNVVTRISSVHLVLAGISLKIVKTFAELPF